MASACVNNIGMSPEKLPAVKYPSYGWLSPRASFSREFPGEDSSKIATGKKPSHSVDEKQSKLPELADPEPLANGDFEFRLDDPVTMLPADELFSEGKLVPLQLSNPSVNASTSPGIRSPDTEKPRRRIEVSGTTDPYLFSPKAPKCSSRWKELLGLKKLTTSSSNSRGESSKTATMASYSNSTTKSLKHFLHRSSKSSSSSSSDTSLSLPLLKETASSSDCESVSISSSRFSLSSSSSGHEHEDLPRLSLDSDKPNPSIYLNLNPNPFVKNPHPRIITASSRMGRSPMRRAESAAVPARGLSVDSPRMNPSGKIVFQSLERSSSSPSTFNGGPRFKHRGMERSYSANVRVTPVLNVPVCSLRGSSKSFGFGQLFSSQQKKEGNNGSGNSNNGSGSSRTHHCHHHQQPSNGRHRSG